MIGLCHSIVCTSRSASYKKTIWGQVQESYFGTAGTSGCLSSPRFVRWAHFVAVLGRTGCCVIANGRDHTRGLAVWQGARLCSFLGQPLFGQQLTQCCSLGSARGGASQGC